MYSYSFENVHNGHNRYTVNLNNKSKLTDISGFELFNSTIKNNLKYLELYNNNISSIESLSEFSALIEVSVTGNIGLTNFSELSNHKNLNRLIAHSCGLTSISALTGCTKLTELTIQSNSGLSSLAGLKDSPLRLLIANNCNITDISALEKPVKIGEEEVVNNKKDLYYLNLDNNVNLETVTALGDLIGLTNLYLDNNTNMNPTQINSTLADPVTHILANCGNNYRIPKEFLIYFSTLTSYDYSYSAIGEYLTDTSPEIIALTNKVSVTRLNLKGQNKLNNTTLNNTLKTMTGLKYLNLNGCSLLTTLDFVGVDEIEDEESEKTTIIDKVKNLVELDIRTTGVGGSELEKLNNYSARLQNLFVSCTDITPKNIVTLISNIYSEVEEHLAENLNDSWISPYRWVARGFVIVNSGEVVTLDFKDCSLTGFISYRADGKGVIFDFSNVSNVFTIRIGWNSINYKFPKEIGNLYVNYSYGKLDFSKTEKCNRFEFQGNESPTIVYLSSPINVLNGRIKIWRGNLSAIDYSNLVNLNSNTGVQIGLVNLDQQTRGIDSLIPFSQSGFKNLIIYHTKFASTTLNIDMANKTLIDIQRLINVTTLNLQNIPDNPLITSFSLKTSEVGTINNLGNCTSLTSLTIKDSNISNISFISNLKRLTYIDLSGNNITDLSPLLGTITTTGEGENKISTIRYTSLDLSNNNIGAYVTATNSNVDTLLKLYDAGLRTLKLNGNQFSQGQADRLIAKYGSGLTIDYVD